MNKMFRYVLLIGVCLGQLGQVMASDTLRIKTKLTLSPKGRVMTNTSPTGPSPYASEYRGYPRCDTSAMTVAVINASQYHFGLYKEKLRTEAQFLEQKKRYAIDTTQLIPRRIKSYVSIFTGLKGSKKIIIADANNNHDFSDDVAYEFDTLTMERNFKGDTVALAPVVKVQYETAIQQAIQPAYTYLRILPYNSSYGYPGSMDMQRRLAIYVQPQVYREGNFTVDGQAYKVTMSSGFLGTVDDYSKSQLKIQLADLTYEANKEALITIGKEMLTGNQLFTAVDCTRDGELTLTAERYEPNRVGGRVRNIAPVLLGKTDDGTDLSITDLLKKGNYVLLDFWGSWCGPCIASMPALKILHDRVNTNKIRFVGIDYEYNEEGREKARKLEADKQLSWQQVIELSGKQTKESIPKQLDVTQYPTFMLLSPDGRIVAREVGEDGLITIRQKLMQLRLLGQ